MSTKIEGKAQNDWAQDDDDDWDDWGDAEDNFEDVAPVTPQVKAKVNSKTAEDTSQNNGKETTITATGSKTQTPIMTPTTPTAKTSSWGGLFGGVVSSVLSTATEGLGNITSTVSQGLNQVIGVPDPEELARINAAEQAKLKEIEEKEEKKKKVTPQDEQTKDVTQTTTTTPDSEEESRKSPTPVFGLNLVTSLGSKVINTGLDTLEGIGKKTMDILQENDPLLMKKRKMLGLEPDRPNLSEVLKEAKQQADQIENSLKEMKIEKSRALLRFELLFENHCGLVHLEALEILSKESALRLQTLKDSVSGNALNELEETVNEVKELLEMEELEGESEGDYEGETLNEQLKSAIEDAELPVTFDEIINNWTESLEWLNSEASKEASAEETFAKGLTALAQACALEVCKLHKIAELLLVKEHHSTANEVDSIVQLCKHFNAHLNGLTNRYAHCLSAKKQEEERDAEVKQRVSTLFSEMLQATQQIEKAFKLFLPILQIGAV